MRKVLLWQDGNSQFLDALTTVMSLAAQYLMNGKRLENWHIWIAADVIYIWVFCDQKLYLSAVLYALFIVMCVAGLKEWRRAVRSPGDSSGTSGLAEAGISVAESEVA